MGDSSALRLGVVEEGSCNHVVLLVPGAGLAAQVPDKSPHPDLLLPDPRGPLPSLGALPQQRPRGRRHAVHQLFAQHAGPRGMQIQYR